MNRHIEPIHASTSSARTDFHLFRSPFPFALSLSKGKSAQSDVSMRRILALCTGWRCARSVLLPCDSKPGIGKFNSRHGIANLRKDSGVSTPIPDPACCRNRSFLVTELLGYRLNRSAGACPPLFGFKVALTRSGRSSMVVDARNLKASSQRYANATYRKCSAVRARAALPGCGLPGPRLSRFRGS